VKQEGMCKSCNDAEQEREEASNDHFTHVFIDSHGGEGIDVEELLRNIECEDLLENRKGGSGK
jgi:hypothetical protein